MSRIAHLTSAHPRHDTRIFFKQCRTLAAQGHEVSLVVADGGGPAREHGVRIVDVGRPSGRLQRMLRSTRRVGAAALALDADIYHLHDPELMPVGLDLKRAGRKVLFDAHEDLPAQLLGKPYLGRRSAAWLARGLAAYERRACRQFDGVVAATATIRDKFLAIQPHTIDVHNYPLLHEFAPAPWSARGPRVCYVGGITAQRGARELVRACALLRSPARLTLAGRFDQAALHAELAAMRGWARVDAPGHLDRTGVAQVMASAVAGLVTLQPAANYLDALPVKMFEYMAAGIPVIASHFPRWRALIDRHACGLCVDPGDAAAIAAAIDRLVGDPALAAQLGANGRRAVERHFNWHSEASKLVRFYEHL